MSFQLCDRVYIVARMISACLTHDAELHRSGFMETLHDDYKLILRVLNRYADIYTDYELLLYFIITSNPEQTPIIIIEKKTNSNLLL